MSTGTDRELLHKRIEFMAMRGMPVVIIARRLGTTRQTVYRVINRRFPDYRPVKGVFGTWREFVLWHYDKERSGATYHEIGLMYGVSAQMVYDSLKKEGLEEMNSEERMLNMIRRVYYERN